MLRTLRVAAALIALPAALLAQRPADQAAPATAAPAATPARLRVFLDCPTGGCDRNFFVTEMPFALWTLDRLDADVHLLITNLGTGAGGAQYTLGFIGRRAFTGRVDTLRTAFPPNTTEDTRRRELVRVIQLGLVPYVLRTADAGHLSLRYAPPAAAPGGSLATIADPWDFWVYRIRANGSGSAESRSRSYDLNGSVNASRVTEAWKLSFNAFNEYRSNTFTLSDSTKRTYVLRSADVSARIVRSVSEHWSVGTRLAGGLSEFRNQDANGSLDVSAEYNVYPWREATSRQLIALVAVGGRYFDYVETTIYGLGSEVRPVARAIVAGESRQAWGTVDASLRYTRFLHDADTYSVSFNGRTNLRLTRGLSLELRGEAAKVNDQLYLPRGDATDDEVLTRQRALATNFRLNGSIGLSFTFGSIYNTIVNPRLDDLGG